MKITNKLIDDFFEAFSQVKINEDEKKVVKKLLKEKGYKFKEKKKTLFTGYVATDMDNDSRLHKERPDRNFISGLFASLQHSISIGKNIDGQTFRDEPFKVIVRRIK